MRNETEQGVRTRSALLRLPRGKRDSYRMTVTVTTVATACSGDDKIGVQVSTQGVEQLGRVQLDDVPVLTPDARAGDTRRR